MLHRAMSVLAIVLGALGLIGRQGVALATVTKDVDALAEKGLLTAVEAALARIEKALGAVK